MTDENPRAENNAERHKTKKCGVKRGSLESWGVVASKFCLTAKTAGRRPSYITGVSFVNYVYIRNVWAVTGDLPILYRYIDWFITVPLQVTQFYLILSTVRKVPKKLFWKLLIGSFTMLLGGYLGESRYIPAVAGFVIAIAGWIYILYEIYSGDAGIAVAKSGNKPMVTAYNSMKKIVAVGWAVYPLGYIFVFFSGAVDLNSLNIIYNIADFVNKIAFVLVIWAAAMQNTSKRG